MFESCYSSRKHFIKLVIYHLIIARNTINSEYVLQVQDVFIAFETLHAIEQNIADKYYLLEILDEANLDDLVSLDENHIILKDRFTGEIIKSIPIYDSNPLRQDAP